MVNIYEGDFQGSSLKIGIVCARFNEFIVSKLLSGAIDALKRHSVDEGNIHVSWTPGAFEIPLIAKKMVETNRFDAIITLGAVIKGSTPHFDYVCSEVSKGVASISLDSGIPIIFGVLTVNSIEEAIERAGTKAGNKGFDAALAAIETINLIKNINKD